MKKHIYYAEPTSIFIYQNLELHFLFPNLIVNIFN